MLTHNSIVAMYPPLPSNPHTGTTVTADLVMPVYHSTNTDLNHGLSRLGMGSDALPDIVHSHNVGHIPSLNQHRSSIATTAAVRLQQRQRPQHTRHGRVREGNGRSAQQRSRRQRTRSATSSSTTETGRCKEPCLKCVVTVTSLQWVLILLSMLGVLFVVSGIVMAVLHAVGNDFLIYALVFIGLGVMLVSVVVVAWRCTPPGSEPIHALFNIGDSQNSRREHRPRRTRRLRDGQWHGGMLYPEFQYRRPPPSYAASMQAYHTQLDDNNITLNNNTEDISLPGSPPPSYRSRASTIHSGVHITFPPGHDSAPNSHPPTYRSRANSHQRPCLTVDSFQMSPSSASDDVPLTSSPMTADIVQQIIGTHRSHRRQQSAGAAVWYTDPASDATPAQSSQGAHHRRVASMDHVSATLNLDAVDNQKYEDTMLDSEPAPSSSSYNTMQQSASTAQHNSELPRCQSAQTAGRVSEFMFDTGEEEDGRTMTTTREQYGEPDQYNTAL